MDAVNPDYLAARALNRDLPNPVWVLPTAWFPILGNLYHGVQNYYVGLAIYKVLGMNIVSVRLAQALFGAAIIALLYAMVVRATDNRWLALLAAAGLATDVAFLASFRTQNYIILGGEAWLFAALLLLYPRKGAASITPQALILSGICYGLAIYGYFVFVFFGPAIAWLVFRSTDRRLKYCGLWIFGFIVGMLPYVAGYLSMIIALGGVTETLDFLRSATRNLSPFSSKLGFLGNVRYALEVGKLALANGGNELMIFGEAVSGGRWPVVRLALFCFAVLMALLFLCLRTAASGVTALTKLNRLLVLLPICYFAVASLLGQRLWAHHFSVLTPLAYLIIVIAIHGGWTWIASRQVNLRLIQGPVLTAIGILLITGNLVQQSKFFGQLEKTGGSGRASNALTTFAENAFNDSRDTVYLFPDWGFFMSFALLTGNHVPYALDVTPDLIRDFRGKYARVRLAFWNVADREKYEMLLQAAGVKHSELEIFRQRDGKPAFYVIHAQF
ncbi:MULTISPECIES: glycosyltransferase family 39 protein [unclassified Cupriavidus]|uniref:glycosyltransferase family 39 protein n=1 Tax=unclassified Cupriavidus TaxID=2640874 RepID=UPI00190F58EF|nr:glycosyltransferase family 39 protein [Cupriavidus sp. SK-3]